MHRAGWHRLGVSQGLDAPRDVGAAQDVPQEKPRVSPAAVPSWRRKITPFGWKMTEGLQEAEHISAGLASQRCPQQCPGTLCNHPLPPCSPHTAHQPPVHPENWSRQKGGEEKTMGKGTKSYPGQAIRYSEIEVLNLWCLSRIFFSTEQYHAIKHNLSLGEMDATEPVPDLKQKSIDVTLRSVAADV